MDTDAFDRLLAELATWLPLLHEGLELTRVGTHGPLFRWAGASRDRLSDPCIIISADNSGAQRR